MSVQISAEELKKMRLTGDIKRDTELMKNIFANDDTVIFRSFQNANDPAVRGCIIFSETLVDSLVIDQNIVRPLINCNIKRESNIAETAAKAVITTDEIKTTASVFDAQTAVMIGDTAVIFDGSDFAVVANSKKYKLRGIGVPETEDAVNGPKESFCELIVANIGLIRRKVKNPNLKFRFFEVGRQSRTRVCLSYIEGLCEDKTVAELIARLSSFEIDSVLDTSYISELISDRPASLFPTMGETERPDVVAAKLFEGRAALLVDGTPYALTFPFLFLENFQASEDYYQNPWFASLTRALRFAAFFMAVSLPAIYVALISYHKEMIPRNLILSIAKSRAEVPFPASVEMFILLFLFDILREAGVRLPKAIGVTVSTVGAIVLGESIVSANIVSAEMIIIVAVCAMSAFLTPKLEAPCVVVRFCFLVLASLLGIYGYTIGVIALCAYISSLRSYDVSFMSYIIPQSRKGAKDTYIRAPWRLMKTRPSAIQRNNEVRLKTEEQKKS